MASFITLGLLALASASPVPGGACPSNPGTNHPAADAAPGFRLAISAAKGHALSDKVHGKFVSGVHFGAGIDAATPSDDGSVFHAVGSTVVRGFGQTSQGFRVEKSPDNGATAGVFLQFGPGTDGVSVVDDGKGGNKLGGGQYMVCDEHIPIGLTVETTAGAVPDNCVAVTLIPECADLGDEGKGQKVAASKCSKKVVL